MIAELKLADDSRAITPIIQVRDLTKAFGRNVALDSVSLSVPAGDALLVAGPNGSGKSTLIKVLCGILRRPKRSMVLVRGMDPWSRRREVFKRASASFEDYSFPDLATGRDYLSLMANLRGLDEGKSISQLSGFFGLVEFWDYPIRTYSSGMRRKVGLAQALLGEPDLMMLDEPFVALDRESRKQLIDELTLKSRQGTTMVISSHQLTDLDPLISHVIFLIAGKKVVDARPSRSESLEEMYNRTLKMH